MFRPSRRVEIKRTILTIPTVDHRHFLHLFPSRPTGGRGVAACSAPPAGLKLNAQF